MRKKSVFNQLIALTAMVVLFLAATGCNTPAKESPAAFDMVAAQKAIDARNAVFMEAWLKGDSAALANCYTADAKIMPPNEKASSGKADITHVLAAVIKEAPGGIKMTTNNLWGNDDLLVEDGTWAIMDKGGKILDQGKQIEVWKKEDGTWKLLRDCFNSDLPVPSAK